MKVILITLALTMLASCGERTKTKYVENPYDDSGVKGRLTDLEQRVGALEDARLAMIASANASQAQIDALIVGQTALSSSLTSLQLSVSDLSNLTAEQNDELKARMDAVESAVSVIEDVQSSNSTSITANTTAINAANAAINQLASYGASLVAQGIVEDTFLRSQITALQGAVSAASSTNTSQSSSIAALQASMNSAQSSINSLSAQIVVLQNNMSIVELIDPCGDGVGYDEVLFKLSNGKIVGSFSDNAQGLNTRFSVLTQGSYITTDATGCHFSVNASNVVSW